MMRPSPPSASGGRLASPVDEMPRISSLPPWAVIAAKPLHLGKSRLRLPDDQRVSINRAFLLHVLETVTMVLPPLHVVVISSDERVLMLARRAGARALPESPHGDLNIALSQGARFAAARGAGAVLSIAADLPGLSPDDLHAMMHAHASNDLVLAPDEHGTGTNAMVMAPNRLPYRHGPGSLWRHLEAAREAELRFVILRREGLMRDVDLPDQLPALFRNGGLSRTLESRH